MTDAPGSCPPVTTGAPPATSHAFITPALDGPPTGGTLYNARLIDALQRAALRCHRVALDTACTGTPAADVFWIDSLYFDAMPQLRARMPHADLRLLVHYLPSLTAVGRALRRDELTRSEHSALCTADGHLVTSRFMQEQLLSLGLPSGRLRCVEPGITLPVPTPRTAHARVRGVMLCNLVEGKGVLPLLEALAQRLRPSDDCSLEIAGSLEQDAPYAAACCAVLAEHPLLHQRVQLLGPLPQPRALALLQRSDALLSASRMESYGMALAEARALGVPILAMAGGNAGAHVEPAAGGILTGDARELAVAWLGLVRDRDALAARQGAASANLRVRSWEQAATDFIRQL